MSNRPSPSDPGAATHAAGMTLMIVAALIVPGSDAMAKFLSEWIHPVEIAGARFALQTIFFAIAARLTGHVMRPGIPLHILIVLGALMSGVLLSIVWSVSVMPIATAISIFFVEPLILTFFSVLFLGETAGWRRYVAIVIGFGGALIVIRPTWEDFGWYAVLPLFAAFCFATYVVLVRRTAAQISGLTLQIWVSLIAAILLGLVTAGLVAGDVMRLTLPSAPSFTYGVLVLLGLYSGATWLMFTEAFRRTPASIIAPFQYLEIVGATVLGYLVFGDFPDALTWFGTAIILASGLYVFHRERRMKSGS